MGASQTRQGAFRWPHAKKTLQRISEVESPANMGVLELSVLGTLPRYIKGGARSVAAHLPIFLEAAMASSKPRTFKN